MSVPCQHTRLLLCIKHMHACMCCWAVPMQPVPKLQVFCSEVLLLPLETDL
jgi:hypothetical protein